MKKNISKILLLIIGIGCAVGFSYAQVPDPGSTAPGANREVPIHAGYGAQVKNGNLSVDTFSALGNAEFMQQTFIGGVIRGGTPSDINSTVFVGGLDSTNILKVVDAKINGKTSTKSLVAGDLVNGTDQTVCANTLGKLVLCAMNFVSPSVMEMQNIGYAIGPNFGPGGVGLAPGYSYDVNVCLPNYTTQTYGDEVVTVKWTGSNSQSYQTTFTIYADRTKNGNPVYPWYIPLYGGCRGVTIPGPSTGTAGEATNVCVDPEDPSFEVAPAQQC